MPPKLMLVMASRRRKCYSQSPQRDANYCGEESTNTPYGPVSSAPSRGRNLPAALWPAPPRPPSAGAQTPSLASPEIYTTWTL